MSLTFRCTTTSESLNCCNYPAVRCTYVSILFQVIWNPNFIFIFLLQENWVIILISILLVSVYRLSILNSMEFGTELLMFWAEKTDSENNISGVGRVLAKAVNFPNEVRPFTILPFAIAVEVNLCSAILRHSATKTALRFILICWLMLLEFLSLPYGSS